MKQSKTVEFADKYYRDDCDWNEADAALAALITEIAEQVIGEDEYKFGDDFDKREVNRDQLRAEQRATLPEVLKQYGLEKGASDE